MNSKSLSSPSRSLFDASPSPGSSRDTNPSGWTIAYTDGGSRGNPGPSGYGVVLQAENGTTLAELSDFLGLRTNNVAEYSGLLAALEYALAHGLSRLRVISDSELMVKQMRGQYRVQSPDLKPLYDEARRRAARLEGFEIQHVLRGRNKRADELANQAMDRGMRGKSDGATPADGFSSTVAPPVRPLRGIVKEGKISLLEGSIPEGTIVLVMPEKALGERVRSDRK